MMPTWIQIGAHRCYVEDNLFVMELCGPVAYSEIALLLAPQDELLKRLPSILTLCDARQTELPDPQVRRFLAERGKRLGGRNISSVVITNSPTSFLSRNFLKLPVCGVRTRGKSSLLFFSGKHGRLHLAAVRP